MASKTPDPIAPENPAPTEKRTGTPAPRRRTVDWFALRQGVPRWQAVLLAVSSVALCLMVWWFLTLGEHESRIVGSATLPSPYEAYQAFPELWSQRKGELTLIGNTLVTLRRVAIGFLLAVAVGVPLGVAAGCFPRVQAFLSPLVMFGRNIPIAALLPLLLFMISDGELQKVGFIFFACVAFIVADSAQAVADVAERYVDTAYTLGANRWQTVIKVLFPLALPSIFNSCRLLFGLAFGYVMLTESIKYGKGFGGLGYQINVFQHIGPREGIYLIILVIPVVAFVIDRILYWVQVKLFPHQYGGDGILYLFVRQVLHLWDDLKRTIRHTDWPPAGSDRQPLPRVEEPKA
jgi:ABC-type nitrate/sulfonate/bicarbonate transport system permease component